MHLALFLLLILGLYPIISLTWFTLLNSQLSPPQAPAPRWDQQRLLRVGRFTPELLTSGFDDFSKLTSSIN